MHRLLKLMLLALVAITGCGGGATNEDIFAGDLFFREREDVAEGSSALSSAPVTFVGVQHPTVPLGTNSWQEGCLDLPPPTMPAQQPVPMSEFTFMVGRSTGSAYVSMRDVTLRVDGTDVPAFGTCLYNCDNGTSRIGLGEDKIVAPIINTWFDWTWGTVAVRGDLDGTALPISYAGPTNVGSTLIKPGHLIQICTEFWASGPATVTLYKSTTMNSPADPYGFLTAKEDVYFVPPPDWDPLRVLWVNVSGDCGGQPCNPVQNWIGHGVVVDPSQAFGTKGWAWPQFNGNTVQVFTFQ